MHCESLKPGNVFVDFSVFHFPCVHCVLHFLTLGEVREGIKKVAHHDGPWGASHEERGVSLDIVEPGVLHLGPSLYLRSFEQQQKVGALLYVVVGDCGSIIHQHELTELRKEMPRLGAITIELVQGVSFEVEVSHVLLLQSGKRHWVIPSSSGMSWLT